jgi:hypothetical protein
MLLDFGNQWIYSPIELFCLFSQGLMVGIKDLLEGEGATIERERERALVYLPVYELCRVRKQITVVGQLWRYKYHWGPNGQ